MGIAKADYGEGHFLQVRDFLAWSYKKNYDQHNWLIDRWNFCRYASQSFHGSFDSWPGTVGLWLDGRADVAAVVNSEGEGRGEAFIQLARRDFSERQLGEFLDHAQERLRSTDEAGQFLNLRVNPGELRLKRILEERGYRLQGWREATSSVALDGDFGARLPGGFAFADALEVEPRRTGIAHARAFGYRRSVADDDTAEKAFASLRRAPDFDPRLSLSAIDEEGAVACFATLWRDGFNSIGVLEPVGTVPERRNRGLGKATIHELIRRARDLGIGKVYVGSDQDFYQAIGFAVEYEKEVWRKDWD